MQVQGCDALHTQAAAQGTCGPYGAACPKRQATFHAPNFMRESNPTRQFFATPSPPRGSALQCPVLEAWLMSCGWRPSRQTPGPFGTKGVHELRELNGTFNLEGPEATSTATSHTVSVPSRKSDVHFRASRASPRTLRRYCAPDRTAAAQTRRHLSKRRHEASDVCLVFQALNNCAYLSSC